MRCEIFFFNTSVTNSGGHHIAPLVITVSLQAASSSTTVISSNAVSIPSKVSMWGASKTLDPVFATTSKYSPQKQVRAACPFLTSLTKAKSFPQSGEPSLLVVFLYFCNPTSTCSVGSEVSRENTSIPPIAQSWKISLVTSSNSLVVRGLLFGLHRAMYLTTCAFHLSPGLNRLALESAIKAAYVVWDILMDFFLQWWKQ